MNTNFGSWWEGFFRVSRRKLCKFVSFFCSDSRRHINYTRFCIFAKANSMLGKMTILNFYFLSMTLPLRIYSSFTFYFPKAENLIAVSSFQTDELFLTLQQNYGNACPFSVWIQQAKQIIRYCVCKCGFEAKKIHPQHRLNAPGEIILISVFSKQSTRLMFQMIPETFLLIY